MLTSSAPPVIARQSRFVVLAEADAFTGLDQQPHGNVLMDFEDGHRRWGSSL